MVQCISSTLSPLCCVAGLYTELILNVYVNTLMLWALEGTDPLLILLKESEEEEGLVSGAHPDESFRHTIHQEGALVLYTVVACGKYQ